MEKEETHRAARRTVGDPVSENRSVKAIIMGLPRTRRTLACFLVALILGIRCLDNFFPMDIPMARAAEISKQDSPRSPPRLARLQHLSSSFYLSQQPFPLAPTGGTFPADKAAPASAGQLLFFGHRGSPAFSCSCLPFEM